MHSPKVTLNEFDYKQIDKLLILGHNIELAKLAYIQCEKDLKLAADMLADDLAVTPDMTKTFLGIMKDG